MTKQEEALLIALESLGDGTDTAGSGNNDGGQRHEDFNTEDTGKLDL